MLNYGFHPNLLGDVFERTKECHMEDVEEFIARMDKDLELLTGIIAEAQRSMKEHADRERVPVEFKSGDSVLFISPN